MLLSLFSLGYIYLNHDKFGWPPHVRFTQLLCFFTELHVKNNQEHVNYLTHSLGSSIHANTISFFLFCIFPTACTDYTQTLCKFNIKDYTQGALPPTVTLADAVPRSLVKSQVYVPTTELSTFGRARMLLEVTSSEPSMIEYS